MPTFETPEPIHAFVDVGGASVRVQAVDPARTTTVEVRPHNPDRSVDVDLAGRTTVEYARGRLTVRAPRSAKAKLRGLFGGSERVDISIELPAGSSLEVRGWGGLRADGPLGRVDVESGLGDIHLESAGEIRARTSMGEIHVVRVEGRVDLRSSAGNLTIGTAGSHAVAKTSAGDIRVEEGRGEMRLATSAGDVRVDRALAGVVAKTSAGDIRLGSVCTGDVDIRTSYGELEVGIARGTAAWLDVNAGHGRVRSNLEDADGPGDSELRVKIRAATSFGDIVLNRA